MAVAKAVSANPQRLRGNITMFVPGNVTSGHSQVTELVTVESTAYHQGSKGLPLVSSAYGRAKALSSGSFAFFDKTKWVMLGNSITLTLSGVANTVLKSGAAMYFRRQFARKTTYRTHFTTAVGWTAPGTISSPTYVITVGSQTITFSDDASEFVPTELGELTFMNGSKNPVNLGYQGTKLW